MAEPNDQEQNDVQSPNIVEPAQNEGDENNNNPNIIEEIPKKIYKPANPTIKECIHLSQMLPVNQIDKNIDGISSLIYSNDDLLNEFVQKADNRTSICNDDQAGPFIKCEQNRDGDSYRSPHSNKYYPNISDGTYPSSELRKLEEKLNFIFKLYAKQYYSSTTYVSVYCWDLGNSISNGFGVAVLIKNSINHEKDINVGVWDSSNLITVTFSEENGKKKANYSIITTVSLNMSLVSGLLGNVNLSGSITRNDKKSKFIASYLHDDHVENIGVLVEDIESKMRNTINTIYVMKSKEIIDTARYNPTLGKPGMKQAQALKMAMMASKK